MKNYFLIFIIFFINSSYATNNIQNNCKKSNSGNYYLCSNYHFNKNCGYITTDPTSASTGVKWVRIKTNSCQIDCDESYAVYNDNSTVHFNSIVQPENNTHCILKPKS